MGFPSPQSDKVSVCLCIFHRSRVVRTRETPVFSGLTRVLCTYMSVQGPVVYFELVDKDLHGASDLMDLQQELSLLPLVDAWKTNPKAFRYNLVQQSDKCDNRAVIEPSVDPWCVYTVYQPASLSSTPLWSMRVPLTRLLKGSKAVMLSIAGCFFPRYS